MPNWRDAGRHPMISPNGTNIISIIGKIQLATTAGRDRELSENACGPIVSAHGCSAPATSAGRASAWTF